MFNLDINFKMYSAVAWCYFIKFKCRLINKFLFHFQVRWWTQIRIRYYREELELCSFFSDVELVWIIQSAHSFGIITGPILKIDLTLCTPENPAPHESTTVCMLLWCIIASETKLVKPKTCLHSKSELWFWQEWNWKNYR